MILDEKTLEVLKNFQTINNSIILEEGNVIRTMTPGKTIFAQAKIENPIPAESPIYDLQKFLGLVSLHKTPEIDFMDDNNILVKSGNSTIRYRKANPSLIAAPPKGKTIKLSSKDVVFKLPNEVVSSVKKAMSILQTGEILFVGEEGKLFIKTTNTGAGSEADFYAEEIGECDSEVFVVIDADRFRLLPRDYEVSISKQGVAYFKSEDDIEYWLTLSKNSSFSD